MRARPLRLVALAVVLTVGGCSDDEAGGDVALPASASAPATTARTVATATTGPASPATTQAAIGQAALQEAIADVEGLGELETVQLECLTSRLAGDDAVLAALGRGVGFDVLEPDLQERVLLMAVDCAPSAVAASLVDGIGAELDAPTRACVVDRMAADAGFLVTLVEVALATRDAPPGTTALPPAVVDELVTLVAPCDVPPTALPE